MGTILSFADRFRDSGQWTASERSRLEALTERFFGGGESLHLAYGATDDGAPWCAVMNQDDEVLVHIARVADRFLAHFVTDDVVAQGDNLRDALGHWLSPEPERYGVVVPFNRTQTASNVLVMLAVAGFLEDQLRLVGPLMADDPDWQPGDVAALDSPKGSQGEAGATADHHDPSADPQASDTPDARDSTTQTPSPETAEVVDKTTAAPPTPPAETPASREVAALDARADDLPARTVEIRGGDGDDLLVGGARAERLIGGHGADRLVGGGGRDTLDGGAGDDQIVLTAEAVAIGGAGADTFVVMAPHILNRADTLLGTILDFDAGEGDRLVTAKGQLVHGGEVQASVSSSTSHTDQRVEIDFDGDGQADGYVLIVRGASRGEIMEAATSDHDAIQLAGVSFDWIDIVG